MNHFQLAWRGAVLLLALVVTAGCTATKPLPSGFYHSPGAMRTKLPIRVAVVSADLPKEAYRGDDLIVRGKVTLDAYPQEVAAMLGEIYSSVTVVPTIADAASADLRVHLGSDYPANVTLDFRNAATGEDLAQLTEPGAARVNSGTIKMGFAVPYNIFFIPTTLGIVGAVELGAATSFANHLNQDIQAASNQGLQNLRARILQTEELILSPAQKKELRGIEEQGDTALAGGDPIGALLSYQQALAKVMPGSARALVLQGKTVQAAVQMQEAPPVPGEAQDLMARGRAAMTMARSPEDYGSASDAMERALALAPWWSAAQLNTALVQEGGGQWENAIAHLNMYLQLEPKTSEREKIRLKLAELKLHQERGDKPVGAVAGK